MDTTTKQHGRAGAGRASTGAAMVLAAAAGTLAFGLTMPASAEIYGNYVTDDNQLWGVTYMPDFDQKRAAIFQVPGLPGDGGMYCVPTATMNVLAYLDTHGSEQIQLQPIPYVPGNADAYAHVTNQLDLLGFLMETSTTGGTNAAGWYMGTDLYLPSDGFVLYQRLATEGQSTTTREIAKISRQGGLGVLCYGRWNSSDGIVLDSRDTGHCVTPTRIEHGGGVNQLRYRNPSTASEESMFHQSDYVHASINIQDAWYWWNGQAYLMSRMMFAPSASDTRLRLIDYAAWIFPQQGITNGPSGDLKIHTPNPIDPTQPTVKTLAAPGGTVIECEMSPDRTFIAYIAKEPTAGVATLWRLDTASGEATLLETLAAPGGLSFGRDGSLFVGDGANFKKFPVSDGQVGDPIVARTANGAFIKDLAYDDETDQVYAVGHTGGINILMADGSVRSVADAIPTSINPASIRGIMPLPGSPYQGDGDTDASDYLVWRRSVGTVALALWTDSQFLVLGTDAASGDVVPVESLSLNFEEIKFASMDQHGKLYLVVDDTATGGGGPHVKVFDGLTATAPMQEDPNSPFANLPAGDFFQIGRSRTNYRAALHSGPGWDTNTPLEEVLLDETTIIPDCPADWNFDQAVDVFDLLGYLDEWFAGTAAADLTGDETTDVFDLLSYLDLWFAGC